MVYRMAFADGTELDVEFSEPAVGPKVVHARTSYRHASQFLQRQGDSAILVDDRGLAAWEPVTVVAVEKDEEHMNTEAATSHVVLRLLDSAD